MIAEDDLERFLGPLLTEWNRLSPAELRSLQNAPLARDPAAQVSYLAEDRTPYGYRYVELEIAKPGLFRLGLKVEGEPGDLSMAAYHPVVDLDGDEAALRAWLKDLA